MPPRRNLKADIQTNRDADKEIAILEMYRDGYIQREIAEHFEIGQQWVSEIIRRARKEEGEPNLSARRQAMSRELEEDMRRARRRWLQTGDPGEARNLQRMRERYCRLWGLDAPQKLQVEGPATSQPLRVFESWAEVDVLHEDNVVPDGEPKELPGG